MKDSSQKVKLVDLVEEVKSRLAKNPKWPGTLQSAKNRLKAEHGDELFNSLPIGGLDIPIEKIWVNYEIQRDVNDNKIMDIIEKFMPSVCTPSSAVEIEEEGGTYIYVYDGQHRAVLCALLGFLFVRCSMVKTKDKTFPAKAFRIVNESGITLPSKLELYRTSLYRLRHGDESVMQDKDVREAQRMHEISVRAGVDWIDKKNLKVKRRQAERMHDHYFTMISLIEKEVQGTKGIGDDAVVDIMKAIKEVYTADLYPEIEQGLYFGLYEMVAKTQEKNNHFQKRLKRAGHEDWMQKILQVLLDVTGDPKEFQQACRSQHKHHRGGGLTAGRFMSGCMGEIYQKFTDPADKETLPFVPYNENDDLGITNDNLHPHMESLFEKYKKKQSMRLVKNA